MNCAAPFLAIAIYIAFPFVIWTFLDIMSGTDEKDWAINTVFRISDDDS